MGLQIPSVPSVLSLTPSLGTPCSVQWLAVNICLCICQAVAEPLRRQLHQAPVSKLFMASTIVLDLVTVYGMDLQPLDGLSFSPAPHFVSVFPPVSILFSLLRRTEISTLWCSFFLSFMWSVNCIVGILSFLPNIHLSVSAYCVCSFVSGMILPHSGWYFLVPSICQ